MNDLYGYRFPDEAGRQVYRLGDDSSSIPVVLLHEIGGLAPSTVEFAGQLVDSVGCVVHMPLLFGRLGQESPAKGFAQLCWSRQLVMLLGGQRSPIADWLADLCAHIGGSHDKGVTVIGMCATGGLVFSVLAGDGVAAGVAAQPSLPLRLPLTGHNIGSLGASVADVTAAAESGKPLLAPAYSRDMICPAGRMVQIEETFPGSVMLLVGSGHSTLVQNAHPAAIEAVVDLLEDVYGVAP